MYGLQLVRAPYVEPMTLAQAKSFINVSTSFTLDDSLILGLITAARNEAEAYIHRAIFSQQWLYTLDRFPYFWANSQVKSIEDHYYPYSYFFTSLTIQIPKPKCISVDSMTYVDPLGTTQTMTSDEWMVDTNSEPARLTPAFNNYWPVTYPFAPGNVQIGFTCGSYGDGITTNTCPQNVVTAIMLLTSHLYINREGAIPIPDAFYRLLDSERVTTFNLGQY